MRIWKDIYKRRIEKCKRRELKATRRKKSWILNRRRILLGKSPSQRSYYEAQQKAKHLKPPSLFSIKKNPDEVFKFIDELKKSKNRSNRYIFIQLKHVDYISNGAIALMLSAITELQEIGIKVSGSYPNDKNTRKTLEKSGFFNFVLGNVSEENRVSSNALLQEGNYIVDPVAVAPFVLAAMEHIWGQKFRNQKLQGLLVELMANTVKHAFVGKKKCKWHLSIARDEKEPKVTFTFIDNGQGIINTLKTKFFVRLKAFVLNSNSSIVKAAFNGEFGSRTKEINRGRGLPFIKKCFTENYISNLVVITNGVYMNFETNTAKDITHEFQGTCYYWELNLKCKPWNIL